MQPKELYRFVEQASTPIVSTVTSADTDEMHENELYVAMALGRDEVEQKNELSKANLTVTVSLDNEMGRRWLRTSIDVAVSLTVFRKDVTSGVTIVVWKGRLSSVKPTNKSIQLVFESVFTSLRRPGLRVRYQRTCPHPLYGDGCYVDKEFYAVSGAVTSAVGTSVIMPAAAALPAGWFTTGIIEAPDGSLRFITKHSGENLTLIRPSEALNSAVANAPSGQIVNARIFPGCDRTPQTCRDKFNNLNNNVAFPFIPLKNPFGGSSIV